MACRLLAHRVRTGFTLAEVLITLTILGVVATFTIPKIIAGTQNSQYNAVAHEAAATLSGAYQQLQATGTVTASTTAGAITPYLNYTAIDTASAIDGLYGGGTSSCSATNPCYKFHNGSVLMISPFFFNGTGNTNEVEYYFDPDGKVTDGTTNGPGHMVQFELFYNGKITSRGQAGSICSSNGCWGPYSTADPPWFSW